MLPQWWWWHQLSSYLCFFKEDLLLD